VALAHALAQELNAVSVADDAIEDGVGESGILTMISQSCGRRDRVLPK